LRADALFERLWNNSDAADRTLARAVMSGEHRWLEEGVLDPSVAGAWIADAEPGPSKREDVHRTVQ